MSTTFFDSDSSSSEASGRHCRHHHHSDSRKSSSHRYEAPKVAPPPKGIQLGTKMAEGHSAVVFKTKDPRHRGKFLAIKRCPKPRGEKNRFGARWRDEFRKEASIVRWLRGHDHIIELLFYEEPRHKHGHRSEVRMYFPWMDGHLRDLVVNKYVTPRQFVAREGHRPLAFWWWFPDMVRQCLTGLDWLHLHGICHRDVRAHNMLWRVGSDGRLHFFVSDFGRAGSFRPMDKDRGLGWGVTVPEYYASKKKICYSATADVWQFALMVLTLAGVISRDAIVGGRKARFRAVARVRGSGRGGGKSLPHCFATMLRDKPDDRPTPLKALRGIEKYMASVKQAHRSKRELERLNEANRERGKGRRLRMWSPEQEEERVARAARRRERAKEKIRESSWKNHQSRLWSKSKSKSKSRSSRSSRSSGSKKRSGSGRAGDKGWGDASDSESDGVFNGSEWETTLGTSSTLRGSATSESSGHGRRWRDSGSSFW